MWPGLSNDTETAAWTLNGNPLVHVPSNFGPADLALPGRERFLKRMQDAAALARAAIPVERIAGPVLLFSGKDDQLWPSDLRPRNRQEIEGERFQVSGRALLV